MEQDYVCPEEHRKLVEELAEVRADREVIKNEALRDKAERLRIENEDAKADQIRNMAWLAMWSIIVITVLLVSPVLDPARIEALSDLLTMFYIAQAGVVSVFFGSTAYMTVNKS